MKKAGKRIIFISLAVVLLILLSGYIYVKTSVYRILDKKKREEMVSVIRSSPSLPERLYEIYNEIFPKSLERGQLHYLLTRHEYGFSECPCRLAAYESVQGLDMINIAFWLEGQVTQKECLNFYAARTDFPDQLTGISQAADFYFNKSMEDLTDYELVELILMMHNPFYYNKRMFSERLEKAVNEIIHIIKL